jgi:hypothetical protein
MQNQMRNRKIRVPAAFAESRDQPDVFECALRFYSFAPGALHKTLREGAGSLPLLWRGESIGRVCMFEGPDAGVRCLYLPAGSTLAREAVESIRQGWVTGLQLEFDIVKYRPGQLKEVRMRGVTFVRALAGVQSEGRESLQTISYLTRSMEKCHYTDSEFGLRRADNRAERLKSLCEHAVGQSPPEAHGAD